jgi:hypothetical protein
MHWGAPILSPGLDPETVARVALHGAEDNLGDPSSEAPAALRAMLDVQRVDVQRLANSDLFAVRITLGGPIDRTKLAEGESVQFDVRLSALEVAAVYIDRNATAVYSFTSYRWDVDGESAHVDGHVVEIYGVQRDARVSSVRVATSFGSRTTDSLSTEVAFPAAARSIVTDLSSIGQNIQLDVPIVETFVLGSFDPRRVWDVVQTAYGLSDHDYDGVAMYQSFYTDVILYAGGFATGGNPRVDGIAPFRLGYGAHASRAPTLLHMNQLTYNYSAAEETASKLLLHEFGHRWLYFFRIVRAQSRQPTSRGVRTHGVRVPGVWRA